MNFHSRETIVIRLLIAILLPITAFATVKPDKPVKPVDPKPVVSVAGSSSDASAYSNAASSSTSNSSAHGVATSESGGNTLTVNESNPRQTPGMAQGSFAIQGCAVAGNAGGSGTGATGFLGIAFTPQQCYDFMLIAGYGAFGDRQPVKGTPACAALEGLNNSKAGKRLEKRGVTLPTCTLPVTPVPTQSASTAPTVSGKDSCASKEYVGQVVDRALKDCSGK